MRIAITSQNRHEITGHAGRCRNFWIYEITEGVSSEIKGKKLLELPKEQSLHEHSRGQPHPLDVVKVLISGGMGPGMQQHLASKGIRPIITSETDPDRAIDAFLNGSLPEKEPSQGCGCTHHAH